MAVSNSAVMQIIDSTLRDALSITPCASVQAPYFSGRSEIKQHMEGLAAAPRNRDFASMANFPVGYNDPTDSDTAGGITLCLGAFFHFCASTIAGRSIRIDLRSSCRQSLSSLIAYDPSASASDELASAEANK